VAADLVLLDWDLPGMEHQALLAALQKYNPSLKVVVLSSRMEERQAALLAGADAFVSKADPPEKLMTTVSECWKKWRESLPFDLNTESAPAVPKAHSCRCFSHGGG
jgi:CheY-like chemotaxis protein